MRMEMERGTGGEKLSMKEGEKVAAMEAQGVHAGGDGGVGEVNKRVAAMGDGVEAVDAFGGGGEAIEEAHVLQDELAGGLEENARAEAADVWGLLEKSDAMALAGDKDGGGEAGDAATGDGDGVGHGRACRAWRRSKHFVEGLNHFGE